jgi:antitoxin (DNA-binding transcriptional repressor) of toxin-antitoxin stability system
MGTESDFRRDVTLSATEASRSFSKVLDQVEAGRRFLVRRHGRDICVMAPPQAQGRSASECLAILRTRPQVLLDGRFGEDLLRIIAEEPAEERSSWGS